MRNDERESAYTVELCNPSSSKLVGRVAMAEHIHA